MAMFTASRRITCLPTVLGSTYIRLMSTSFREEKDTFGPILVPSDKFVLSPSYFPRIINC